MMRSSIFPLACACVAVFALGSQLAAGPCRAQCSQHEITAVVLFDSLGPEPTLRIQRLHITPGLEITNPTDAELLAAVDSVFGHDPYLSFHRAATAGDYHFYVSSPLDFGAAAIVDARTGDVVFAGEVVWAGRGALRVPTTATHEISSHPGPPAAPPSQVETFPAFEWYSEWPGPQQLTQDAVEILLQTDLLHAFAGCGDYSVVGFTYTPTIGAISPDVASQVIVVNGRSTPPWVAIAVERTNWGRIKGLFR